MTSQPPSSPSAPASSAPAVSTLHLLDSVCPPDLRAAERQEKESRLAEFLDRAKLSAVILRQHSNIAWATAGQVDGRISIADTGSVTLLLTRDGRKYYFASNNEAQRLADEEFPGLDYQPIVVTWHQNSPENSARAILGDAPIGSDTSLPGMAHVDLAPLRAPLTKGEIARYRWLCAHTAEATTQSLLDLKPGISEHEMAALVSRRLLEHGIMPTVLLMATDNRIRSYKHAVARSGILDRYGMLNLCARKWGLAVSLTRFVHFGPPPSQLSDAFYGCAEVNARLLHASRSGASASDLFAVAQQAYRIAGYSGDEQLHHQGGPIGYTEREWLAAPQGTQTLSDPQTLAWNPSIRGAKVEDTTLLNNGAIEVLTLTPSLPRIDTTVEGVSYPAANVLIR